MHALVVGANGLVGSRLVSAFTAQGHHVTALARGPSRLPSTVNYRSVDLADGQGLADAIAQTKPEVVVNCAAMTDVDGCERAPDQAYLANVEAVATLARACRASGAHLTHVSTDYVFDGEVGAYPVDATPNPRGVYAITKHLGEQTLKALLPADRFAICRTAVVYGYPPAGQKNFGSWLYDTLSQGQTVKLFADQTVSPSLALNVAAMLAEVAARRLTGTWHTCGATVLDRVQFGHALCDTFGFDRGLVLPSRMADVKLASPRPAKSGLDVSKTVQHLTTKPWTVAEQLQGFATEVRAARATGPKEGK